jgi:2-polyprenyl-3-methyl-5-hydroxy-6-metoxy-1,4-benzoquinol methylase
MKRSQVDEVRKHYGPWANTYGRPDDDGPLMAMVRAREDRIIDEFLALGGTESILDAGCGTGARARALKDRGHVVWAIDCTPEMVAIVDGHVDRAMVADLHQLELGRTFDLILCIGAMEFSHEPGALLKRLRAHVAPSGRLIVLVPRTGPGGWLYRFIKGKHGLDAHLFGTGEMRRLAKDAGFAWEAHRTPFVHNFVAVLRADAGHIGGDPQTPAS